jgi:hypothetical protein
MERGILATRCLGSCDDAMPSPGLAEAFKMFDANGSGTFTPDEAMSILTRPGAAAMSPAVAREFIAIWDDTTGDGRLQASVFMDAMEALNISEPNAEELAPELAMAEEDLHALLDALAAALFMSINRVAIERAGREPPSVYVEAACEAIRVSVQASGPDAKAFARALMAVDDRKYNSILDVSTRFSLVVGALATRDGFSKMAREPAEGQLQLGVEAAVAFVNQTKKECHTVGVAGGVETFKASWRNRALELKDLGSTSAAERRDPSQQ